jgi:transposase
MDNMRVHHSRLAKEMYEKLKLVPLFNIAYSPQFNPIECVFSMMKANYKRMFLKSLIDVKRPNARRLIEEAIRVLEIDKIRRCI